jgi:alkylresorcinol/alkylpyrone synthase
MPRIVGVSTAVPSHTIRQADVKTFIQSVFSDYPEVGRLMPVFDNAQVDERHFIVGQEWFRDPHSFTETNDLYIVEALRLSEQVTTSVAESVGVDLEKIDLIIFVSTTGVSTPSIDARLFNRLKFSSHLKRLPIWGLGCAAGASALSRAFDYTTAYPEAIVLIVSIELCGLAFQKTATKENIIAAALFGDGAAGCIVAGDNADIPREELRAPHIIGSLSTTYPDTLDVMGWRITAAGFELLLSKDIPTIVTKLVKPNIDELLDKHRIEFSEIKHFVTHPGGAKVLDAYRDTLGLHDEQLGHARSILRENGNMSSATVFFILNKFLRSGNVGEGDYGLISALGPGFSSELLLIRW